MALLEQFLGAAHGDELLIVATAEAELTTEEVLEETTLEDATTEEVAEETAEETELVTGAVTGAGVVKLVASHPLEPVTTTWNSSRQSPVLVAVDASRLDPQRVHL